MTDTNTGGVVFATGTVCLEWLENQLYVGSVFVGLVLHNEGKWEAGLPDHPPTRHETEDEARAALLAAAKSALFNRPVEQRSPMPPHELSIDRDRHDTDAVVDVIAERRRQITEEFWDHQHDDDEHSNGELARAASCYALHAGVDEDARQVNSGFPPAWWPWTGWWKPRDRRRDLVRAGALILAEIERLDRAAVQPVEGSEGMSNMHPPTAKERLHWEPTGNPPRWKKQTAAERFANLDMILQCEWQCKETGAIEWRAIEVET